jgi:hypothetical protein
MSETPDVKKLELRIQELENQLKRFQQPPAPQSLTAEEIATYHKVGATLAAFDDWGCGINECRPVVICRVCRACVLCRICRICINECSCGPCNVCGTGSAGGGGGFSGFGG